MNQIWQERHDAPRENHISQSFLSKYLESETRCTDHLHNYQVRNKQLFTRTPPRKKILCRFIYSFRNSFRNKYYVYNQLPFQEQVPHTFIYYSACRKNKDDQAQIPNVKLKLRTGNLWWPSCLESKCHLLPATGHLEFQTVAALFACEWTPALACGFRVRVRVRVRVRATLTRERLHVR